MEVVVNKCYGGFGISPDAILALIKRNAKCIKVESVEGLGVEHTSPFKEGYEIVYFGGLCKDGKYYNLESYYDNRSVRTDPDLIAVVKELGDEAEGKHARLRIVEIPDDITWEIHDYDGIETVREKHRHW